MMTQPVLGRCDKCPRDAVSMIDTGKDERFCEIHLREYEDEMKEFASRDLHSSVLEAFAKSIRNDERRPLEEHARDFMEIWVQTVDHSGLDESMWLITQEVERRKNRILLSVPSRFRS